MPWGKKKSIGSTKPVSKAQADANQSKNLSKLNRKVSVLYRRQKAETGIYDSASAGISVGTGASFYTLTGALAQGDTQGSRDGDKVGLKFLDFRATITPNGAGGDTEFRMIIFKKKSNSNGSVPASWAEMLQFNDINSPRAYQFADQYTIYHDKVYKLFANSTSGESNGLRTIHVRKLLHNSIATWAPGTTTYYNNHLFVMLMSTNGTNSPSITYYARTYFSK